MLPWIGLALLATTWLLGLPYYHQPDGTAWAVVLVLGTLLLGLAPRRVLPPGLAASAAAMILPALAVLPWPFCAPVWLVLLGLLLEIVLAVWERVGASGGGQASGTTRQPATAQSSDFACRMPCCDPALCCPPVRMVLRCWSWVRQAGWLPGLRAAAGRLSSGLVVAGSVMLVQSVVLLGYQSMTARSHELPWPLPNLMAAVGRLIGIDMAACGSNLPTFSMRETHMLGATWELLLDPVTLGFLAGAGVLMAWYHGIRDATRRPTHGAAPAAACAAAGSSAPSTRFAPLVQRLGWKTAADVWERARGWVASSGSVRVLGVWLALVALTAAWLPLRSALYVALFLHGVLRTEYEAPLNSMRVFWSPWIHLMFLAVPVLVAWRLGRRIGGRVAGPTASNHPAEAPGAGAPSNRPGSSGPGKPLLEARLWRRGASAAGLAFLACALATGAVFWDPVGRRLAGRVVVEEYHPDRDKIWEPTFKPFDTEWYGHESGYNYYCIYDYLTRYYQMSRLERPIDQAALAQCDVLILKVPTRPYADTEIRLIEQFVRDGGGLLLIGEHTSVFDTGLHLNAVAERFGFRFRYDCLFGVDSVFDQRYHRPLVPHPVVQNIPWMEFATSCSLEAWGCGGRAVIQSTGLKNKGADYHVNNYYPQPFDSAEMRYGAFVQLWSTRYGRGRVLAFTDSTIFSNFSTFEPGKAELMLGMVEWLNHRTILPEPRPWLGLLGLACAGAALWLARAWDHPWLLLGAAAVLGFTAAVPAIRAAHRLAMPEPEPIRPFIHVVMDRTTSQVILPTNGFISGKRDGFGLFERWILRLGYFTSRREGQRALEGNLLVIIYPTKSAPEAFHRRLVEYVAAGGHLLLVDSPENHQSTAEPLLRPFGLRMDRAKAYRGTLRWRDAWPEVPIAAAHPVRGGKPMAWLGQHPVAATTRFGRGSVTVVGCGSRFCDYDMGVTGDVVPDEKLRRVYDVQFALLRAIIEGRL